MIFKLTKLIIQIFLKAHLNRVKSPLLIFPI